MKPVNTAYPEIMKILIQTKKELYAELPSVSEQRALIY